MTGTSERDTILAMEITRSTPMGFVTSITPLPNGEHEMELPNNMELWKTCERMGLDAREYGSTWFVYESRKDYLDSLD